MLMMIVKALQAINAIKPFVILNDSLIAREAPIVPNEIAEMKLKTVICAISFLPIILVKINNMMKAMTSLKTNSGIVIFFTPQIKKHIIYVILFQSFKIKCTSAFGMSLILAIRIYNFQ